MTTEALVILVLVGAAILVVFLAARGRASQQTVEIGSPQAVEREGVDQEADAVMKVQYLCDVGKIHVRALMDMIHKEICDLEHFPITLHRILRRSDSYGIRLA